MIEVRKNRNKFEWHANERKDENSIWFICLRAFFLSFRISGDEKKYFETNMKKSRWRDSSINVYKWINSNDFFRSNFYFRNANSFVQWQFYCELYSTQIKWLLFGRISFYAARFEISKKKKKNFHLNRTQIRWLH